MLCAGRAPELISAKSGRLKRRPRYGGRRAAVPCEGRFLPNLGRHPFTGWRPFSFARYAAAVPDAIALAARFVAALYAATRGRPGQFRRIDDCAERAGITKPADIERAMRTAEAGGLLVVHVSEPMVMLTAKGREAARA